MSEAGRPGVLVIAPMPAFPTSAGNRQRLLATCTLLKSHGYAVDFAYLAHEDQIYRRFGQHPPRDDAAAETFFRQVFRITPRATIPLRTKSDAFGIDDWCPPELDAFVEWYGARHPEVKVVVVNYVFLSRCLERVGPGVMRIIDTHDRFADRHRQYIPFRTEPNFFHTDTAGEAFGLSRADLVLAIQDEEARFFRSICDVRVQTLPPRIAPRRSFTAATRLRTIGFIGHGNDANLYSIRQLIAVWVEEWTEARPELVIAGEICRSLPASPPQGVRHLGFVDDPQDFYDGVDAVVAPMIVGTGLKMKVAEALAFGVPVVGTRIGFEGFETTAPAHGFSRLDALARYVFALADDAEGIAQLTRDCAEVLRRHLDRTGRAEEAFFAGLPEAPPSSAPLMTGGEASMVVSTGGVILSGTQAGCTSDVRHDGLGLLVATERRPVDDAGLPVSEADRNYTPRRRHWFARRGTGETAGENPFRDRELDLSPEWTRTRGLDPDLRAALAPWLIEARMDWVAKGRRVGATASHTILAACLPGDLLAVRTSASFLVMPFDREAVETTLLRIAPLAGPAGPLETDTTRYRLTGQPVSLTLEHHREIDPSRSAGASLLLLVGDLAGRIDIG